jgi:signal transduction histidine kinase
MLWVRLQATVTQSGADAPVWRVTLSEISEQKRAEDALQHAHDHLELRIQERIGELRAVNEALRQRRDQLKSLTRRLVEAQENERAAIARELHDGAGQSLTCMLLDLGALARLTADNSDTAAKVQTLRGTTDGLLFELHTLAANLHPASLDRLGLLPALRQHANNIQTTAGLQIRGDALGFDTQRLPPEVQIAVYRVAEEAVNNAIRHAQARNIGVLLQPQAGRLLVTIEDDGIGFNAKTPAAGRLGLLSMRERIEMLGGSLMIESSPRTGPTVFVEVPM